MGIEGGVSLVSCVWGLEGWGVGVGTSADPRRDVQALAGIVVCLAVVTAMKECACVCGCGCGWVGGCDAQDKVKHAQLRVCVDVGMQGSVGVWLHVRGGGTLKVTVCKCCAATELASLEQFPR